MQLFARSDDENTRRLISMCGLLLGRVDLSHYSGPNRYSCCHPACPWGRSIDRLRRAPAQSWRLGSRSLAFPVVPARSPADVALRTSKSDLAMDGRWASACCSSKDSCPRHHTERLAAQLSCSAPSVPVWLCARALRLTASPIHVQQHH